VQERDRRNRGRAREVCGDARRRKPRRSTITPPKSPARTIGRKLKKTARPVRAALPVVVSTNHGIAICAAWFPESEIASAV